MLEKIIERRDPHKPCRGKNVNICVAEGCYNQTCLEEGNASEKHQDPPP
jgi:hypothetical protein